MLCFNGYSFPKTFFAEIFKTSLLFNLANLNTVIFFPPTFIKPFLSINFNKFLANDL